MKLPDFSATSAGEDPRPGRKFWVATWKKNFDRDRFGSCVAWVIFFEPLPTPLSFSPISILVVDECRVWNQIFFKANWIRNKKKIISNPALINNIGGQIMLEIRYEPLVKDFDYLPLLHVFFFENFINPKRKFF